METRVKGCSCQPEGNDSAMLILDREQMDRCVENVKDLFRQEEYKSSDSRPSSKAEDECFFVRRDRVGYLCGAWQESDRYVGCVGQPYSFGDFVAVVRAEIEKNSIGSGSEGNRPALRAEIELHYFPDHPGYAPTSNRQELLKGSFSLGDDQNGVPRLVVEEDDKAERKRRDKKRYNWRCLAACAPGCVNCLADIQCWIICAGACVIACGIDG